MHILDEHLYLAICFFLFVFFVYRTVRRTILDTLDNKINEIKHNVEEAKNLKLEAEDLLQKTMTEVAGLKDLQHDIIQNANNDSDTAVSTLTKQMQEELEIKKSAIQEFIEDKKKKAYDNLLHELNHNALAVVKEYLLTTNNAGLTDIEIAKLLKKPIK